MTVIIFICALALSQPQLASNDGVAMAKITQTIHDFSTGVDKGNVKQTAGTLHSEFRAIVNRLFGAKEVSVMSRNLYLDLLKQGKIGGDTRTVKVHSINVTDNVAVARVTFTGKELVFHTFMQLIEDELGNWLIISDMPNVEQKI